MAWDASQAVLCGAVALVLLARTTAPVNGGVNGTTLEVGDKIWHLVAADPLEAACAMFVMYFFISMCGNSPLAWAMAIFWHSIDADAWKRFGASLGGDFKMPYEGNFFLEAWGRWVRVFYRPVSRTWVSSIAL